MVVITGASAGIGLAAAGILADAGARLICLSRDTARAHIATAALRARYGNDSVLFIPVDLSRPDQVVAAADEIEDRCGRINILINNAGAMFSRRTETPEGFEGTFALNHLGYVLLTYLLLPTLHAAGTARVINVASEAHHGVSLDFDDLHGRRGYQGWRAYQRSKLCNILFTRELARREQGRGLTVACLHPGFIASDFGNNNSGPFRWLLSLAKWAKAEPVATGAERIADLAVRPDLVAGGYYVRKRLTPPGPAAQDEDTAHRLWERTMNLLAPWL